MASPNARDFAITGLPRSGTTYLSAVLHDPPRVVTISDPAGAFRRFHREHGVDPALLDFFGDFRRRVQAGEPIPTLEGTPGFEGTGRVDTWNQKKRLAAVAAERDFHLGLKNPEIFLAHLGHLLDAGLRCAVSVRHPVAVIHSWSRRAGKLADGDSPVFRSRAPDAIGRRIELHNHLVDEIRAQLGAPGLLLVRHEDWFRDADLLGRVCSFLGLPPRRTLRPPPIPAEPPSLADDEVERILAECTSAAELGYPLGDGRLAPPPTERA